MRQEIANLVYPIISFAVRLKERLDRGEAPDFASEQATLKRLLLSDAEARQWADFGGDESTGTGSSMEIRLDELSRRDSGRFFGIRYALVCWLDELFILNSPWKSQWNEQKLEVDLYRTNDRAWRFWEQASMAAARPAGDAQEVFFLCVMLGFRGEYREQRDKLGAWVAAAKGRAAKIRGQEWPYSLEVTPPTRVPPLHARDRFQRMVLTAGVVFLGLVPMLAFLIVHRLGN
jgi:type VI secretion system protein ImpK